MLKAINGLGRQLPPGAKTVAKRLAGPIDLPARKVFRLRHDYPHPLPPVAIRVRVGAGVSVSDFVSGGAHAANVLVKMFEEHGQPLDAAARVLDWGCGCGRLIVHVKDATGGAELHGCDVDPYAIDWDRRMIEGATFALSGYAPPLPYEDGTFDAIYGSSIFTHFTEAQQEHWLKELRRVAVRGSLVITTVNGDAVWKQYANGTYVTKSRSFSRSMQRLPALGADELRFIPYPRSRWNRTDYARIDDTYGLTFHGEEYVRESWSKHFEVLDFHPGILNSGQDLVVLRVPDSA
jgi:SAM-dependent methyltransferase